MATETAIPRGVLSDAVKDRLLEQIVDGTYPPGSRIVETRVARELGTSQAPVREALRDLEALGVVEISPFRGARVRRPGLEDEGLELGLREGEAGDELVLDGVGEGLMEEEALEEAEVVHVTGGGGRMALVEAGEVLDPLLVELLQELGDGEAVGPRVLEHAGGPVEGLVDEVGPAAPAELARGGALGAPEAADVAPGRFGCTAWTIDSGAFMV